MSEKITQRWVTHDDYRSLCCDAPVLVGDDDVCTKCGHPCSYRKVPGKEFGWVGAMSERPMVIEFKGNYIHESLTLSEQSD